MFESYRMVEFGINVKEMRKKLRLSQKDVERICGVTCDTQRKIESGCVIPRYDTLEYFSLVYKIDMLEKFKSYRSLESYYIFNQLLDRLIIDHHPDKLIEIEKYFNDIENNDRVNLILKKAEIEQYRKMINGINNYNLCKYESSLNLFIEAMQETIPSFDVSNLNAFKYNILEVRNLLLIAISYAAMHDYRTSNKLMFKCVEFISFDGRQPEEERKIAIKILFNISYNFFELKEFKDSVEYARKGIKNCIDADSNYLLPALLYRKGIGEYFLENGNYKESLMQSIQLLDILGNSKLSMLYKNVTKEKYGINLQ